MELLQGFIQPPKAQSVDETIPTLCDRVENATLIGDRRSAILGLKSFSREYREAVVASGLKPLLSTLKRDFVDEASVKAILETLLILFIRGDGTNDLTRSWISQQSRLQNGKYPSPLVMKQEMETVDQFSLWIADAITQSEDMVHLLIQLLETNNFHVRLYTIQILEALVATRPARARKAITSLPTGISTLVSLLDDVHETVRDEMILLLMAVVNNSSHVQGLVAFENIFERLFSIIEEEGGLRGSIVVNDCLSLIHNILKYNTSNQTLFLETGNLPKLAHILNEPLQYEDFFWNEQRIVNINTALDIVTLTVVPGTTKTEKHQHVLLESNVLMIVLRLAFHTNIPRPVRPIAVLAAADMVRDNELSQAEFSKIDVPFFDPSLPSNSNDPKDIMLVPVVDLLVNWCLYANSVHTFSIRMASAELLKCYLKGNQEQQSKFIQQQILAYKNPTPLEENIFSETFKCNLFESLLDYDPDLKLNPYKLYFTTDLFMFLFQSENEGSEFLRELTRNVTTGNDSEDEENLCAIQTLSELLITSLSLEDVRIPISYITFLIFWLFGDFKAVDDFLSSKSTIQSLLSFSYQVESEEDMTIKCLVTALLGVSYEFSTKSSPFPRKEYLEFITKTLGKDNYLSRVKQLKTESLLHQTEFATNILDPAFDETGLPQVYFSALFVSFFLDNYYRIKTALTHSPEEEPCAVISFETFEEVQNQCNVLREELDVLQSTSYSNLESLEDQLHTLTDKHNIVLNDYQSLEEKYNTLNNQFENSSTELESTKDSLKKFLEEKKQLNESNEKYSKDIELKVAELTKCQQSLQTLEKELKSVKSEKDKAEGGINKMNRELLKLTKENEDLTNYKKQLEKDNNKQIQELQRKAHTLQSQVSAKEEILVSLRSELEKIKSSSEESKFQLKNELTEWRSKFQSHDSLVSKLTDKLKILATNYKEIQMERDSLNTRLTSINSTLEAEISQLKEKFEKSKLQNEELLSRNKILSTEKQEATGKQKAEILTYTDKIDVITKKIEESETTINNLIIQNDDLKMTKSQGENSIKELESEKKKMELTIQDYESELSELRSQRAKLEDSVQQSQDEVSSLSRNKISIEKELDTLKNDHQKLNDQLLANKKNFEEKLSGTLKVRADLETTIEALRKEVSDLRSNKLTVNEKLKTLKQDLEKRTKEAALEKDVLQSDVCKKEAQIAKSNDEVKELQAEIEGLGADLTKQKANGEELQEQLEKSEMTKSEAEAKQESLIMENNKLQDKINQRDQEIEKMRKSIDSLSSDLEQEREQTKNNNKKMEAEIKRLRSEINDKVLEFEKERKLLNKGSDEVTQEYSEKISQLEEKLNSEKQQLHEKSKKLEDVREELLKLKSEQDRTIKNNEMDREKMQEIIEEQKKEFMLKAENLKKSGDDKKLEIASLKDKIKSLHKTTEDNAKKCQKSEVELSKNERLLTELKQEKKTLNLEFEKLTKKSTTTEETIKVLKIKNDELTRRNEEDVTKLTSKNEELKKTLWNLEKDIEEKNHLLQEKQDLQSTIASKEHALLDNSRRLEAVKSSLDKIEEEKKNLVSSNKSLGDKLANIEKKLAESEATNKEKDVLESKEQLNIALCEEIDLLKKEISFLKEENHELLEKGEQKSSSSELDDLMLLVTDLDEKNARYRSLLKDHGIDVTSDEEEDNDDDDDDDEEDD